jgi:hypothetical protein
MGNAFGRKVNCAPPDLGKGSPEERMARLWRLPGAPVGVP